MLKYGFIYRPDTMIAVKRAIEGISINGYEWLLDKNNKIMKFNNRKVATTFLRSNGFDELSDSEINETFTFEETN